jgi:lipoprotein NlpI
MKQHVSCALMIILILTASATGFLPKVALAFVGTPALGEEENLGTLIRQAEEAFRQGDFSTALAAANKAIKLAPKQPQGWLERAQIYDSQRDYAKAIADYTHVLRLDPKFAAVWQARGEAQFKSGNITASLKDFDAFLRLHPDQKPHHWQRGIALYYAGRFAEGKQQFELHQTVNSQDVENAVWHFLCTARAEGLNAAKKQLIPIEQDARIPMAQVHQLFAGKASPQDVLAAAQAAPSITRAGEPLFYAHLYLGLYFEALGDTKQAGEYILKAAARAKENGYMGNVARVHAERMKKQKPLLPKQPAVPFRYVQAKAFHIPPETTTEESGYFSLCEGRNGKIYIGTAAYGRNSYLVEFDPQSEKMRIVLDTHKLVGLPSTPTGYAAQAKIHTRNFVAPSGKIYFGSKQGYPSPAEKEAVSRGEKIPAYRGGYVMVYDPATERAENLGMPLPLDDTQIAAGKKEGQGVIDVTADEARGLIYVITCEEQRWMLFERKTKQYRDLGVTLRDQPNTIIDAQGRGTAITADFQIARYDPAAEKVSVDPLLVEGKPFAEYLGANRVHPDWRITPDGKTTYLQLLDDLRMFQVDLTGASGQPVIATNLGNRIDGKNPDSRGSISIATDGRVYSAVRIDNQTGFGEGYLHHLVRYDPKKKTMEDLGVFAVKNPNFFDFNGVQAKNPDGSLRPRHGFHTLPDGTLTPLHVIMSLIVAKNGTIYATTIYPFTLLKIERVK